VIDWVWGLVGGEVLEQGASAWNRTAQGAGEAMNRMWMLRMRMNRVEHNGQKKQGTTRG
jgi:hypothetical protein